VIQKPVRFNIKRDGQYDELRAETATLEKPRADKNVGVTT
jgi:hypothetical protein